MSDQLFGSTKSGAAPETKGAAEGAGATFEQLFQGQNLEQVFSSLSNALGRGRTPNAALDSINTPGFGGATIESLLGTLSSSPEGRAGEATAAFDAAQSPFRQRAAAQQAAQIRETFGGAGGRFGSGVGREVREGGAELQRGFAAESAGQFNQLLGTFTQAQSGAQNASLQALLGAGGLAQGQDQQNLDLMGQILQFINPGEGVVDPGLFESIIGAGATLGGAALLPG